LFKEPKQRKCSLPKRLKNNELQIKVVDVFVDASTPHTGENADPVNTWLL
jgi:hypothetical protein